jgi:hypothetical protein
VGELKKVGLKNETGKESEITMTNIGELNRHGIQTQKPALARNDAVTE